MLYTSKTIYILFIIVSIVIVGLFFIYKNYRSNSFGTNQRVTLKEIGDNATKFNGVRVELIGTYKNMFETSTVDDKIWVKVSPDTTLSPEGTPFLNFNNAKVRVVGIMHTRGNYGHLSKYPFFIKAESI